MIFHSCDRCAGCSTVPSVPYSGTTNALERNSGRSMTSLADSYSSARSGKLVLHGSYPSSSSLSGVACRRSAAAFTLGIFNRSQSQSGLWYRSLVVRYTIIRPLTPLHLKLRRSRGISGCSVYPRRRIAMTHPSDVYRCRKCELLFWDQIEYERHLASEHDYLRDVLSRVVEPVARGRV